jgi:hypothetical protein
MKIWGCKIGEVESLPDGADNVMRQAVKAAYRQLTGKEPSFCFSGWAEHLTKIEREVADETPKKEV